MLCQISLGRLAAGVMLVFTLVAFEAWAEEYNLMPLSKAQRMIFPEAVNFVEKPFELSDAQKDLVAEATELKVRFKTVPVWLALDGQGQQVGIVVVDRVIGKHEFITYAVGIRPQGKATMPVILDYRESYGQQIEQEAWRRQFVGKTRHDVLKVGKDIDHISGATLSCVNVTNGVRRLLFTYELVLAKEGY